MLFERTELNSFVIRSPSNLVALVFKITLQGSSTFSDNLFLKVAGFPKLLVHYLVPVLVYRKLHKTYRTQVAVLRNPQTLDGCISLIHITGPIAMIRLCLPIYHRLRLDPSYESEELAQFKKRGPQTSTFPLVWFYSIGIQGDDTVIQGELVGHHRWQCHIQQPNSEFG